MRGGATAGSGGAVGCGGAALGRGGTVAFGVVDEVAVELRSGISHGSQVGREGIHDQPGPGAIIVVLLGRYIVLGLSRAFRSES